MELKLFWHRGILQRVSLISQKSGFSTTKISTLKIAQSLFYYFSKTEKNRYGNDTQKQSRDTHAYIGVVQQ